MSHKCKHCAEAHVSATLDTPETEHALHGVWYRGDHGSAIPALCRRLERERNLLRSAIEATLRDNAHLPDGEHDETATVRVRSIAVLGGVEIPIFDAEKEQPPDRQMVIIEGGIGYFTDGKWRTGVGNDTGRDIEWVVKWWTPMLHGSERPNDQAQSRRP